MEFWLSFNNREEVLQLPVPPKEYKIQKGLQIATLNVNSIGEIATIGKGLLAAVSLESFFPAQEYPFCQYSGIQEPYYYVRLIEKWMNTGKPIRLMITDTNINMACCIERFEYGERDGTGDVYFSISLKEYRLLNMGAGSDRAADYTPPKTYTVKQGDTPLKLAKIFYGDSSKASLLLQNNAVASIKEGMVLLI